MNNLKRFVKRRAKGLIMNNLKWCFLSMGLGAVVGCFFQEQALGPAVTASHVIMRLMQVLGTPLIFFSLLSTILETGSGRHMRELSKRTIGYTILTTSFAVVVASIVYFVIRPGVINVPLPDHTMQGIALPEQGNFFKGLINIIPTHIFGVFTEGNVIGAVLLSVALGFAGRALPAQKARIFRSMAGVLSDIFLLFARYVVRSLPLFLWAFVVLFVRDVKAGFMFDTIIMYVVTLVVTHTLHAFGVIPALLRFKGFSFLETLRGGLPALMVAAVSKSSSMAVPTTLQTVVEKLGVRPAVARFTIPVCSTLNINGCAAFIFVTTMFMLELFKGQVTFVQFGLIGVLSVFITLGAASVPMGCFFLTTSVLSAMDVPAYMMGTLLPFFSVFDMLDTSVNVWSDVAITRIINKETSHLFQDTETS